MEEQFTDDPVKQEFLGVFRTARHREFSRDWPSISEKLTDAIRQVIMGEKGTEEIVEDAAVKIDKIRKTSGEEMP